jgi:hypothetical protein
MVYRRMDMERKRRLYEAKTHNPCYHWHSRLLDKRMNDAGLLRLMVSDPLAMNMSNTLGYLRGELKDAGKRKQASFGKRVLEIGFIKKILLVIYNKIFSWYYS